jgi:hypothetical protein
MHPHCVWKCVRCTPKLFSWKFRCIELHVSLFAHKVNYFMVSSFFPELSSQALWSFASLRNFLIFFLSIFYCYTLVFSLLQNSHKLDMHFKGFIVQVCSFAFYIYMQDYSLLKLSILLHPWEALSKKLLVFYCYTLKLSHCSRTFIIWFCTLKLPSFKFIFLFTAHVHKIIHHSSFMIFCYLFSFIQL